MKPEHGIGDLNQQKSARAGDRSHRGQLNPALLVFLIFPVMGMVAAIVIGIQRSPTAEPSAPPAVVYTPLPGLINQPAPDFALRTPDGETVRLGSLRGQWVFLNFWATWCPPCRQEMPTFQMLLDGKFGPVAGKTTVLAVDSLESAETVKAFLHELKLSIPVVLDSDGTAVKLYGAAQLPITFIIDPAGIIRYEHLGEMKPAYVQEYLRRQDTAPTTPPVS